MSRIFEGRKNSSLTPLNDFYQTPICLTQELLKLNIINKEMKILDSCCGDYAITNVIKKEGFDIIGKDIKYGNNFFEEKDHYDVIIMNPPFKLFDEFIIKAKELSPIVISIAKISFFGSHSRNIKGIWKNLKDIYIFDRQIAYDKPLREDGKAECGMLVSGWFIWDKNYCGDPQLHIIDIDKYIARKGERK